ncbi:MAG: M1 family metallopeptidase [Betaproteobacteria bacterium]
MPGIVPAWIFAFAVALLFAAPAPAQSRFAFDTTPGILTKDVVPSEYRLALDLDPTKDAFAGVVDITLKVRRPVAAIVLNAFELTAGDIVLEGSGGTRAMTAVPDKEKRQWRIADERAIEPGEYTLRIGYTGAVHAYWEGMFAVAYTAEGKPARMLATQMEPIAARSVFPGFDEPSFRAKFAITVTAPSDYDVVSNMPVKSREPKGDATIWHFAPTPPMSTYLVTVTVGQFDVLEDAVDGIPLRILTAKGKRDDARYAMAVTKQILPFYREYFGIPFALPKLDQLATPGVRSGAMEDWGAISYIENALLYDAAKSSIGIKQDVFEVVAHEVSHQWFGDLVTAASWDEIWLNEAFATWMAQKATAHFNPDWQVPLTHVLWRQRVMRRDAGPSTRSIRSGPVVETAVFDVFDGVTYTKGGAVLDMLETYLGPEAFRRGLNAYFEGQKLSNATAGDLWYYLSQASGKDALAIARTWTDQQGYPLLQARVTCAGTQQSLALDQHRFSTSGAEDAASLWQVPFAASTGSVSPSSYLLADRSANFVVGPCATAPLYIDSSAGYFRVQYSPEHLRKLARAFPELSPHVRMALLTDTLALAQAGRLPLADYLELASRLRPSGGSATQVLFLQAVFALEGLDIALDGTPAQRALRRYARKKLAPMLAQLSWNAAAKDSAVTLNLRNSLIEALGQFGDEPVLRKSAALFAVERKGGSAIDPSIRPAVMSNVARRADAEVYTELVRRLKAADRVEDRWLYAEALGHVESPELAQRLLALSLEDSLPPDIASSLPRMLADATVHGDLAYAFTRDHFDALAGKKSEWGRAGLLPGAASNSNDAAKATALLADQKRLVGAAGDKSANETAGDIELRSRIKAKNSASLATDLARISATTR